MVNFDNTVIAFQMKNDAALDRAYFLFKLISNEPLVKIGTAATNFALNAQLPVEGLIRATVFDHFCGGVSEEDCLQIIKELGSYGVQSILDYSVEGKVEENQFDLAVEKNLEILSFIKSREKIPFAVFKPTALGSSDLFYKVSEGIELNESEKNAYSRIVERYHTLCSKAKELNLKLLVDAEESWLQKAADDLCLEMMKVYNTEQPILYNTYQMYRWDKMKDLEELFDLANQFGFFPGIKLVRGAYMEKERKRANEKGYTSPICKNKQETDINFDKGAKFILNHIEKASIFIGSHNEHSTLLVIKYMEEYNIPSDHRNIWFGQLYGMSDHISFNLAKHGYNVSKYIPYGPVKDVMPSLIRRAEENTSVAGQTNRELELIKRERSRRKLL